MRKILSKILLMAAAIVVTIAALEAAVSLLVETTDYLEYESFEGVGIRLKPGQEGLYLADSVAGGPTIRGHYRVNSAGFNSIHEYDVNPHPDTYRVAIIGDSFVEALQVDYRKTFQTVIEEELRRKGISSEVYSFGISSYGTAQAVALLERYVLEYSPDFVLYVFIPNDVEDSSPWRGRTEWSQQFDLDPEGELVALPMTEYVLPTYRSLLKRSALFRYFFYQKHWAARIRSRGIPAGWDGGNGETIPDGGEERAWLVVEKLLRRMDQLLGQAGVPWLLVWQGDADPDFEADRRGRLEEIVRSNDLPYLDLSPAFSRDFEDRGLPHTIAGDGHWNLDGHEVAGAAMAEWLSEHIDPAIDVAPAAGAE